MQGLNPTLERILACFFLFCFAWVLVGFTWRYFRHKRHGIAFPRLNTVRVLFHEGMASGNSDKSLFSRFGGASNCLRVTVTDNEVWVRGFVPFNLITESDLEHRIPRDSITSVQLANSALGRRVVLLDFRLPAGGSRRLSLFLRQPERFLATLKGPPPLK